MHHRLFTMATCLVLAIALYTTQSQAGTFMACGGLCEDDPVSWMDDLLPMDMFTDMDKSFSALEDDIFEPFGSSSWNSNQDDVYLESHCDEGLFDDFTYVTFLLPDISDFQDFLRDLADNFDRFPLFQGPSSSGHGPAMPPFNPPPFPSGSFTAGGNHYVVFRYPSMPYCSPNKVPEPSAFALLGFTGLGLALRRRF